jgi:hypothetical protein
MPRNIFEECLECGEEYEVEVTYGPLEGDLDYEYPDARPACSANLEGQAVVDCDVREDFHSDC